MIRGSIGLSEFNTLIHLISALILCQFVACAGDKSTNDIPQQQKDISFVLTGSRTIQIWSAGELSLTATAKSGEKPALTATGVMDNAWFLDNRNGTGYFAICPTKDQIGNYAIKIMAATSTEKESLTVRLTIVDDSSSHQALIPVAQGNRWIYQSVHSRLLLDTIEIKQYSSSGSRITGTGAFYPTVGMLDNGIILTRDSILSNSSGLQFLIPEHVPATIQLSSRGACYFANLTREIDWTADPVIVPAGRFIGCFRFTSFLTRSCDNLDIETIAEEIFIKPGVGIVKIAQIKSSGCGGNCSSRWELLNWTIH